MLIICDTHVILFWTDRPDHLSVSAQKYLGEGIAAGELACAAISLWEIAVLFRKKKTGITCRVYTGFVHGRYHQGAGAEDTATDARHCRLG